jgi:DNA-directed RNA polymerase subunit M/transcription elongation factor TFIIS
MSSELNSSRKLIVSTLKDRVDSTMATKFEKAIFDMCQRLSKEYEEPIIDFYKKFAYEKTGHIMNSTTGLELNEIMEDINNDILNWDSSPYKDIRKRLEELNDEMTRKPVTEPSTYKCRSKECGSRNCIQTQLQTRGGDESTTTFVTCMKCNVRYKLE